MHQIVHVPSDAKLPSRVDVVVIGGGIIGACTALYLAEYGLSVAVCEKGEFGAEQSSRNWGWVRKMGRDPRELPLAIASFEEWHRLNQATGEETGFRVHGITYYAADEAIMAKYLKWLEFGKEFGLDTVAVSREGLHRFAPDLAGDFPGGLHTASDGMAEPSMVTAAVIKGARKRGVTAFSNCAVRTLETAGGRVSGVVTEKGPIACDMVVLAGGGWSTKFLANMGLRLPKLQMQANVMRTAPHQGGPEGCGSGPGFGYRKRLDGGYNISMRSAHPVDIVPDSFRFMKDFGQALQNERKALRLRIGKRSIQEVMMARRWKSTSRTPFEKHRINDPEPSHDILAAAKENIGKLFPSLSNIQIVEKIGGLVDTTPDALPVISDVPQVPGFYVSTGYSGHGLGVAPGAGRMLAQIMTGRTPDVNPDPYRFARFSDGTRIEHWPVGF